MSGLKGITINTEPTAEAHIYAEDDAAIYQSIFGSDGVLTIGQQCESQIISNNKVRVKDGVIVVGGHIARIPYGDYEDCEIANGQSNKNRNDIIIAKFVSTGTGGIDTMTCEVKQGTATTSTAADPVLTQDELYESGKIREMPLYRVKIEGLSIVGVEPMFDIVPTIPTLNAYLSQLGSSLTELTGNISANNRGNTGSLYKVGYSCFLHTASSGASDVVKTLSASYRPSKTVSVSGFCRNISTGIYYPCMGTINADGTWGYLCALTAINSASGLYFIYNKSDGTNRLSNYNLWLSGAWATNVNGV